MTRPLEHCTAFAGPHRLVSGPAAEVAFAVRAAQARHADRAILVFDDATGQQVDFDLRGTDAEIVARLAPPEAPRGPGRTRLGVIAREVTLLPRHWEWLAQQPGGASVALRRLVDAARAAHGPDDRGRQARQAADRFMVVLAGDLPGYEEAARALYAGDQARFETETAAWPGDVRDHARRLAQPGFADVAFGALPQPSAGIPPGPSGPGGILARSAAPEDGRPLHTL